MITVTVLWPERFAKIIRFPVDVQVFFSLARVDRARTQLASHPLDIKRCFVGLKAGELNTEIRLE